MTYTAARTWLSGLDPYDDAILKRVWLRSGMPHATPPGRPQTPNVYPLSIAPVLAPIAWMPYPQAFAIWLLINAVAAGFLIHHVIASASAETNTQWRDGGPPPLIGDWEGQFCPSLRPYLPHAAACILMLGFPLHYGLVVGNLAILTALCVVLTLRYRDSKPATAGVLFGLALVKYSVCAPLALLFAFERRKALLAWAIGTQGMLLGAATIGYGGATPLGWIDTMLATGLASMAPGAVNHYASLEYTALHVELSALLYRLSPDMAIWRKTIVLVATVGVALAAWSRRNARTSRAYMELRYVVVLTFTLLAFYHRVYDVIIVVAPLVAWLLQHRRDVPYALSALLWFGAVISMFAGPAVGGGNAQVPYIVLAFVQMNIVWAMLIVLAAASAALWTLRRRDALNAVPRLTENCNALSGLIPKRCR